MMKSFLVFAFILINSISLFADSKTVYYDSSIVRFQAVYDEMNFAFERTYDIYNSQNKPVSTGGDIIFTRDGGASFDTLRSWWWSIWVYDSNSVWQWPMLRVNSYFDKNTLCIMDEDGQHFRYDLTTKKCDTMQLIPKSIMENENDNAQTIEYSILNSNSAIVSYHYYDSVLITKDKGLSWKGIARPKALAELKPAALYPVQHSLINENFDFNFFFVKSMIQSLSGPGLNISGYADDSFQLSNYSYKHSSGKLTFSYIGTEVNFGFPTFINDSTAFVPGRKVYFFSDSLPSDSAYSKPVVYKTTNTGKTWEKLYQSEYFIGNFSERLSIFGDTLILPYGRIFNVGYLMSTDFGKTWKENDISFLRKERDRFKEIKVISPNSFMLFIDGNSSAYTYFLQYNPSVVSVPEEKLFTNDAKLYPNPTSDYANIEFDTQLGMPDFVEVYDVLGNRIQVPYFRSEGSVMLSTAQLGIGSYIVKISTAKGIISKQFVKVN